MMDRRRLIAAIALVTLTVIAAGIYYSSWSVTKKFPVAIRPKPDVSAQWPEIDCQNQSLASSPICRIPRASWFQLKLKVTNLPAIEEPEKGFFIAFLPITGTEDAKQKWYYGGATITQGRRNGTTWEFLGEANVTTNRDQRMRAVLQRGSEPILAEVLVEVESETPK